MSTTSPASVTSETAETAETALPTDRLPVGSLHQVLAAVSDPVRLEMVRRLDTAGASVACGQLYEGIGKSTASHHFKILREAGVTQRRVVAGKTFQELRLAEVEQAYPGVLSSILAVDA